LAFGEAEAPSPRIVGGDVGYGIWLIWKRMEMTIELGAIEPDIHWLRVTHDMEIMVAKVDDAVACLVGDVSVCVLAVLA
jgi:hypothetical protein